MVTREKDGAALPTSQLTEAVLREHVAQAVQKQKGIDLAEQLLFMDPITEVGGAPMLLPASFSSPGCNGERGQHVCTLFASSHVVCCGGMQGSLMCRCACCTRTGRRRRSG